jgi:hypothetical protein
MLVVLKRILRAIVGGTLFQVLIYLLFAIFGVPGLSVIFLWAWILFLGDQSPQSWARYLTEWVIVIAVDNLLYAPLIYFLLWSRELKREAGSAGAA